MIRRQNEFRSFRSDEVFIKIFRSREDHVKKHLRVREHPIMGPYVEGTFHHFTVTGQIRLYTDCIYGIIRFFN